MEKCYCHKVAHEWIGLVSQGRNRKGKWKKPKYGVHTDWVSPTFHTDSGDGCNMDIDGDKLHLWYPAMDSKYDWDAVLTINYCPFCGRKLSKD